MVLEDRLLVETHAPDALINGMAHNMLLLLKVAHMDVILRGANPHLLLTQLIQ